MPLSRKKSCARCRESKARCNQVSPVCSRCAERGLPCTYDGRQPLRASPYSRSMRPLETDLATPHFLGSSNDLFSDFEPGNQPPDLPLDWNNLESLGDLTPELAALHDLGTPTQLEAQAQDLSAKSISALPNMEGGVPSSLDEEQGGPSLWFLQQARGDMAVGQLSTLDTSKTGTQHTQKYQALIKRRIFKGCLLSSILIGQMSSYTGLMVRGDQLPPFIHAPCHVDERLAAECAEKGHQCLPKELAICAGLVQMFCSRTKANSDFAWKTICDERDRIKREYHQFDSQRKLAALQSVTIFLLMQAEDTATLEKNNAASSLETVIDIFADLTQSYDWRTDVFKGVPDRRDWVFRESIRRIACLLHIIDILLEGTIIPHCQAEASSALFRRAPLPCTRDLWEARTNRSWRASYLDSGGMDRALTVGDLIESHEAGCFTNQRNNARDGQVFQDVSEWCEGLDALGSLVWMVLPIEQERARRYKEGIAWR